jgi:putative transposase
MRKISCAGYRFPPEVVHKAIWLYHRFTLSFRDVEDLLAERGIAISYETVRRWVNHFRPHGLSVARRRRRERGPRRASPVQANKHAALKLMRKLLKKCGFVPDRLITDDLRSYSAAAHDLGTSTRHERGRRKNNRAENSHQPTPASSVLDINDSAAADVSATTFG